MDENGDPKLLVEKPTEAGKNLTSSSSMDASNQVARKAYKLANVAYSTQTYDTLHFKSLEDVACKPKSCTASLLRPTPLLTVPGTNLRPPSEILRHAKDFLEQYYSSIKRLNSEAHCNRWKQVEAEVAANGTYMLTEMELIYGAKMAWRNAYRCIGRIQWSRLQVFDARNVTTTSGMFEAICTHVKYATNKGNIRSAITVFPQRTDGLHDYLVWNPQLISYAGYKQADGSILGDPMNVEITEICHQLGWKSKGTKWDILPLVLAANGRDPEYFEYPEDIILQVPLSHPRYPWFEEFGLRWYAVPAVSNMLFDCGGIEFPGAPFNGWYMGTEIGCRNLGDVYRYNITEKVALKMGLDTSSSSSLWKDKALVEMNIAVLYSFQSMNITLVDHHTASETFMKHLENEQRLRGGCPADWVWVVPPLSSSITPVFHQEMLMYYMKPSFEYQELAWKIYPLKSDRESTKFPNRKLRFKEVAKAVKFTSNLFGKALSRRIKATILYATETGKSENYARTLAEMFSHVFNTNVSVMSDYDIIHLEHEALLIVVASTFGNGDPPENGEEFAQHLYAMNVAKSNPSDTNSSNKSRSFIKMNSQSRSSIADLDSSKSSVEDVGLLGNLRFAVFGLGSSAYPNFCAYGKYVDHLLGELGGQRIVSLGAGDELCGQEQVFRKWATNALKVACDDFCVGDDLSFSDVFANVHTDSLYTEGKVRIVDSKETEPDVTKGLMKLLNKPITTAMLLSRKNLTSNDSSQDVILVKIATGTSKDLTFAPGDHLAICPVNSRDLVDGIIKRLKDTPLPDKIINVEILKEQVTLNGVIESWAPHERLPSCTLQMAVARFLDITSPPTPQLLDLFATLASNETEKKKLKHLATNARAYEEWKQANCPNLLEVLHEFPSIALDSCILLTSLPALQPRFYSISSSPRVYRKEIHLTVGVLSYQVKDKKHYGVCTSYLNTAPEGSTIYCFIRNAPSFHLPESFDTPIIMVGPGTGIAPFRSFWQEEELRYKNKKPIHPMTLFFGCRNRESHLYCEETDHLKTQGVIQHTFTAYSRLSGQPKVYVQHLLREVGAMVLQKIYENRGHLYVCGDVEMAQDVGDTLRWILENVGGLSNDQANDYILRMKDESRYHEDIFGISFRRTEQQQMQNKPTDD